MFRVFVLVLVNLYFVFLHSPGMLFTCMLSWCLIWSVWLVFRTVVYYYLANIWYILKAPVRPSTTTTDPPTTVTTYWPLEISTGNISMFLVFTFDCCKNVNTRFWMHCLVICLHINSEKKKHLTCLRKDDCSMYVFSKWSLNILSKIKCLWFSFSLYTFLSFCSYSKSVLKE